MLGFKSFRRAQILLAGIELLQMICKGQLQHPAEEHLSSTEQFYWLAAYKNGNTTVADLPTLMRQSLSPTYNHIANIINFSELI